MVGRLHKGYRSGNIAEALGILLLKGLAAVAEVNRTEDVGIDVVATLLRDERRVLHAEDSFTVQIKSISESITVLKSQQLQWFLNLELPHFLARVCRKECTLALYPTIQILHANAWHAGRISGANIKYDVEPIQMFHRVEGDEISLGAPLLKWSVSKIGDQFWRNDAYQMLRAYLALEKEERFLLQFGHARNLSWQTNDRTSVKANGTVFQQACKVEYVIEKLLPVITSLHFALLGVNGADELRTAVQAVIQLVDRNPDAIGSISAVASMIDMVRQVRKYEGERMAELD